MAYNLQLGSCGLRYYSILCVQERLGWLFLHKYSIFSAPVSQYKLGKLWRKGIPRAQSHRHSRSSMKMNLTRDTSDFSGATVAQTLTFCPLANSNSCRAARAPAAPLTRPFGRSMHNAGVIPCGTGNPELPNKSYPVSISSASRIASDWQQSSQGTVLRCCDSRPSWVAHKATHPVLCSSCIQRFLVSCGIEQ